jgi:WD40 repeat protein
VQSVAFSPDGKKIISGSQDRAVRVWDVASGQAIRFPIKDPTDKMISFALSPDSRKIVSASLDGTVHVWDAQTGQPIGSFLDRNIKEIIYLAFSSDGHQLAAASSDGTVCLWDAGNHRLLASYDKDCVNKMSFIMFSVDGRHLMTCSIDGTTHTWNATTGENINTLKSSGMPSSMSSKPLAFNNELGWYREENNHDLLRCFPVNTSNFGHWAYIDSTLIRRDNNGMTTVMDMTEAERKWDESLGGRKIGHI